MVIVGKVLNKREEPHPKLKYLVTFGWRYSVHFYVHRNFVVNASLCHLKLTKEIKNVLLNLWLFWKSIFRLLYKKSLECTKSLVMSKRSGTVPWNFCWDYFSGVNEEKQQFFFTDILSENILAITFYLIVYICKSFKKGITLAW